MKNTEEKIKLCEVPDIFGTKVNKAFTLLDDNCIDFRYVGEKNIVENRDNKVGICVESSSAYEVYLILDYAEDSFEADDKLSIENIYSDNYAICKDIYLLKKEDIYVLEIVYCDEDSNPEKKASIPFTKAKIEIDAFNYEREIFFSTKKYCVLWTGTVQSLNLLKGKAEWSKDKLNEFEKRLLPLAEFSPIMSLEVSAQEDLCTKEQYELLTEYISKCSYSELQQLLDKFYYAETILDRRKYVKKMKTALKEEKAVALWKLIQNDIEGACKEYPLKATEFVKSGELQKIRGYIEMSMHKYGFAGEYPSFYYNNIADNKKIIADIECYEDRDSDELILNFIIGTKLLKEGGETDNLCEENAETVFLKGKGKRFGYKMEMNFIPENYKEDSEFYIDECCRTAVKLAQRMKLTKNERKNKLYTVSNYYDNIFAMMVLLFLFIGVAGAVIFTLGMLLISEIIGLATVIFFGKPITLLKEFMLEPIWIKMFFYTFAGIEGFLILVAIAGIMQKWFSIIKNKSKNF